MRYSQTWLHTGKLESFRKEQKIIQVIKCFMLPTIQSYRNVKKIRLMEVSTEFLTLVTNKEFNNFYNKN